jgi:hypothetical protein
MTYALKQFALIILIIPSLLFSQSNNTEATSKPIFNILVADIPLNLTEKTQPAHYQNFDSVPLLSLDEIDYVRYEPTSKVETGFQLKSAACDKIELRLPHLYFKAFVIFLDSLPIYSGIIVPANQSKNYLKKAHYAGLVLILPSSANIPEHWNLISLMYTSGDGIYNRKDDPRGNEQALALYKITGKLLFSK